jgi:uncharacterized protein YndB with AHSA1/START domain
MRRGRQLPSSGRCSAPWPRPADGADIAPGIRNTAIPSLPPPRWQRPPPPRCDAAGYVFIDEWDVEAPMEAVFDALSDPASYPLWWRPVHIEADVDRPPAEGQVAHQHFKGRLPYHLHTRSEIIRRERPTVLEATVTGDLSGRGVWTLAERVGRTHVRFDWRVNADRPLLRALTPIFRPLLRWNHNWAIARAIEGLEPYARTLADHSTRGDQD